MSVLSGSTRGVRRGAKTAAAFAGLLITYLVIAAVPAQAVTTCALAADPAQVNVVVGTDDVAAIQQNGANYEIAFNGGAFAVCAATTINYINVTGSDAGAEVFVIFDPANFTDENMSVGLGNGVDSLFWEYGPLGAYKANVPGWAIADPNTAVGANAQLGTASTGVGVGDFDAGGVADLRIDNAENVTLNGNAGVAAGLDDVLDAGNLSGIAAFDFACCGTADAIPGATAPFANALTLNGTNGNDHLVSGNGADNFQGGAGQDSISYEASAAAVTVDLAAATGTGMGADTLADVQDAEGSANGDTLLGNALNNNLFGAAGDDVIDGREGNDGGTPGIAVPTGLSGGDDDDSITDGAGNDLTNGNAGDDVAHQDAASNGADSLNGNAGCDELDYGARTTDTTVQPAPGLSGAAGEGDVQTTFELYVTGSGNDTLTGDSAYESFRPGAGNDTVDGNGPTLFGAGANPCGLFAGDELDLSDVPGPAVFDLITGTATGNGTDTFFDMEQYVGTAGDDTVILGDTNANGNTLGDFIADGGIDTVDASAATTNQSIDLRDFGNDCAPTGCLEVEIAIGGSGNDTLQGNGLNNTLIGNAGVDIIFGEFGNDRIEGGLGNDILSGDAGGDTLVYRHATGGMEVNTVLGFSSGPDGADSLVSFEIILGSDFNDTIVGGQTAFDLPNVYKGFKGNDALTGTNSTDILKGGAGNDSIRAGGGDDTVKGAGGNDLMLGAGGNDILTGGGGNDTANGQQGFDVCRAETELNCEA